MKIKANASMDQNRSYSGLVKDILREADQREDQLYGDRRGDELPEQLRDPDTRRQALADAKRRLAERKSKPVVGQIKRDRHIDRFMRRGRSATQSEWRLVTTTHNLRKLHSHWTISTA